MKNYVRQALILVGASLVVAVPRVASEADENAQAKITRAMEAGPSTVTADATIVDMESGKMNVLRKGTNGFTCYPGHANVIGDDAFCADAMAMQWLSDFLAHKPKPTNTAPGVMYMYLGGADYSATDPWASKAVTPLKEGPHWMIMWPFETGTSGLSTQPADTGTWIMWSGTPYAHLMINQHP